MSHRHLMSCMAIAAAMGLSACGGGDGGDDAAPGPDPAPQPQPPAPVAPATAYTVEMISPVGGPQPLQPFDGPDPAANVRLAVSDHAVLLQGHPNKYLVDAGSGTSYTVRDDKMQVEESDDPGRVLQLVRLFGYDAVPTLSTTHQRTERTEVIAGNTCTVWVKGTDQVCVTADNITLLRKEGNDDVYRATWVQRGAPRPEMLTIPATYADHYGPGNDDFQVIDDNYSRSALARVYAGTAPNERVGFAQSETVPGVSQKWRLIRVDGAQRKLAQYALCLASTVTEAGARCVDHGNATSGPVAVSQTAFAQGKPPASTLWQLEDRGAMVYSLRSAANSTVYLTVPDQVSQPGLSTNRSGDLWKFVRQ